MDALLKKEYLFDNPYKMSRKFLQSKGAKEVNAYGETPLSVLAEVAKECFLGPDDHILDLGCGRGRGVLFLSCLLGCRVRGIEWNPAFVEKANKVKEKQNLSRASFLLGEMGEVDLSGYTAIYLYGTCLEDEEILRLIALFKHLKKGVKIVTISYPLSDYDPASFKVSKSFPVAFPWGNTDIFINSSL